MKSNFCNVIENAKFVFDLLLLFIFLLILLLFVSFSIIAPVPITPINALPSPPVLIICEISNTTSVSQLVKI